MSLKRFAPVTIETAAPSLPAAAEILREYLGEMISRYYGRPTHHAEINRHLGSGHGSDDLVEPVFSCLRRAGTVMHSVRSVVWGCVGSMIKQGS